MSKAVSLGCFEAPSSSLSAAPCRKVFACFTAFISAYSRHLPHLIGALHASDEQPMESVGGTQMNAVKMERDTLYDYSV